MSNEELASAVLPLLIALFNWLAALYVLHAYRHDRSKIGFVLGPAGVGIWSVGWFVSVFDAGALETMRVVGSIGGLVAVSGFALDTVRELDRRRGRVLLVIALAAVVFGLAALWILGHRRYTLSITALIPRAVAVALLGVVIAGRWSQVRDPRAEVRRFAWRCLAVLSFSGLAYLAGLASTYADGKVGIDPLYFAVLSSECLALLYIVDKRVEIEALLSRSLTYAILTLAVGVVAALGFSLLGYEVDLVQVSVTVVIALIAATLFMGVGELLTKGIEKVLFPDRARMDQALRTARDEAAAMRRRLAEVERLAIAGELAASVAHEIKNPLSPIRGYAQLLSGRLESVPPDERAMFEKGLRIIQDESDRIDGRVQELLTLARVERRPPPGDGTVELNRILMEAIAVAEGEPGVTEIIHRLAPEVDRIFGNEDELRGAVLNLLKNAAEAMHESSDAGSRIEVISRRVEDEITVEVIDEGPGIQAEASENIFRAFYTTKTSGTGLGMAIARSAVEEARGTIRIESRSDRSGAIVRLTFPAARQAEPEPAAASAGPVPSEEGAS